MLLAGDLHDALLPQLQPALLQGGAWAYLAGNLVIALLVQRPDRPWPLFALALADLACLSLLLYAAGGVASGLGGLLAISVAIANVLLPERLGLLLAALASLALLYLTFHLSLGQSASSAHYLQAGVLGALCFAAALLIRLLVRRQQSSERLAHRHAATAADLQALNALILEHMHSGILVVGAQQQVLLANPASLALLGQTELLGRRLGDCCPALLERLQQWSRNPTLQPPPLQAHAAGPLLQPGFVALRQQGEGSLLVLLDDVSQLAQQAQQLKLAALGRLAAGIAHEIRNPLGAISHAAQLLQEAEQLAPADRRLTQIVLDHARRMNLIVENVLQLSRRRPAEPQLLDLRYWLHRFVAETQETLGPDARLHLATPATSLQTRCDPQQLLQVLNNLVQNGLRHSAQRHGRGQLWLELRRDARSGLPALEIRDDGDGIPAELQEQLFEPFFTTGTQGTGLGLYLARELCESNRARLDHLPREDGACFRITFAHPDSTS